jgi:O-antigen/teichoic acid export membrane protein
VDVDMTVEAPVHSASVATARAQRYRRLIASQHVRNNVFLLAANFLGALCGYLLQLLLGHRLGLVAYGAVASLLAIAATFLIPTQVVSTIVARYGATLASKGQLAQFNDLVQRLTRSLLVVGMAITALVALVSSHVAAFLHLDSPQGVTIIGVMLGLSFVAPINIGAVQGLQRFSWYALLVALPQVLRFALASGMVILGFGVTGAMLGILLGLFLAYLVSFRPLSALLYGPRVSCGSLRPLWSYSVPATMTLTMLVALSNLDTPLAKHFLSARDAGLYSAMAIMGKIMLVISNSIVMVLFPRLAALYSRGASTTRAVLEAMLTVLAPCLVLEAFYIMAPRLIMRVLFGGPFVAVAGELAAYGAAMLLLGLAQVLIYFFLSRDEWLFTLTLLASGSLQGLLFTVRHQTVGQLVQASVIANGTLVLILAALFVASIRRPRRPDRAPL